MPNPKKTDKSYWKETIMAIDNRKVLEYIRDLVDARITVGRADHKYNKPESKKKGDGKLDVNSYSYDPPPEMEPMFNSKSKKQEEYEEETAI